MSGIRTAFRDFSAWLRRSLWWYAVIWAIVVVALVVVEPRNRDEPGELLYFVIGLAITAVACAPFAWLREEIRPRMPGRDARSPLVSMALVSVLWAVAAIAIAVGVVALLRLVIGY